MFCWVLVLLVLLTVRALRWMMRVPLLMYWVSFPPGFSVGSRCFHRCGCCGVSFGWSWFGCWWRCWCGCRSYWAWVGVWAWLVVGCCWVWALATPG